PHFQRLLYLKWKMVPRVEVTQWERLSAPPLTISRVKDSATALLMYFLVSTGWSTICSIDGLGRICTVLNRVVNKKKHLRSIEYPKVLLFDELLYFFNSSSHFSKISLGCNVS